MTKKSFLQNVDSDETGKKIGRPRVKEPPHSFSNIPFTEEEHIAIEKIKEKRGGDKRQWIKKWIQEGIANEFRAIES